MHWCLPAERQILLNSKNELYKINDFYWLIINLKKEQTLILYFIKLVTSKPIWCSIKCHTIALVQFLVANYKNAQKALYNLEKSSKNYIRPTQKFIFEPTLSLPQEDIMLFFTLYLKPPTTSLNPPKVILFLDNIQ